MTRTTSKRRYELHQPELDSLVTTLVEEAEKTFGPTSGSDFVREMLVSAVRLIKDKTARGDLKLINSALKELRHALFTFAPFATVRKVSVFGSARTKPEQEEWQQAFEFGERIAAEGWMVITGAGDGIMGAAQGGAGRERSFGVNIRLPFEQSANKTIAGDKKLVNFRYFFTRKLMFLKESHAIVLFPGGFGTHDEGFESLTLIQTGKSEIIPVVFVDRPGGSYWHDWQDYVRSHLKETGLISPEDLNLFKVTDDVEVAVRELQSFYSNYHSNRYVHGTLVVRMRKAPTEEQLDQLNTEFSDLLTGGTIKTSGTLPEEYGEHDELPRIVLEYNRRDNGRLRQLIDRVNTFIPESSSSVADASPHEIVPLELPPGAEDEEPDD